MADSLTHNTHGTRRMGKIAAVLASPLALFLAAIAAWGGGTLPLSASASPAPSNLAVLLDGLKGQPLGLYDGVRFVRIDTKDGSRVTVTIQCELDRWRVIRVEPRGGRPEFRNDSFQPAPGISRSSWCTAPVRTME